MSPKYELMSKDEANGLHRIRALRDFGEVKSGDIGGLVEGEKNLSHDGDCWVSGSALVYGNAQVSGNARVGACAQVYGDARIYGNAQVSGYACVSNNAQVYGSALVFDRARVSDNAQVSGNALVCNNAWVSGNAQVSGSMVVVDNSFNHNVEEEYPPELAPKGGIKHDEGKSRVDLLPSSALLEVGKVMEFGARKYAPNNWRKGFDWSRLYGAALRHLLAHKDGESLDKETGLSHLAHASCCLLFLLTHELEGLGNDDRPTKN